MSRVLFINPPIADLVGTHYRMNPALGAPQLTAILRQEGHTAWTADLEALDANLESYLRHQLPPDFAGITVTYLNRNGAKRFIDKAREIWGPVCFMAGGPYATADPEGCMKLGFDVVVTGEADLIISDLVSDHQSGIIPGKLTRDLDSLPFPDFEHYIPKLTYYLGNAPHLEKPEAVSIWNRGCPHKCVFCSDPIFQLKPIRFMSPNRIVAELQYLKSFGAKHVFVYSDELVGMSPKENEWLIEVCQEIVKANLGLTFKAQGRCSKHNTLEVFEAMVAAGFRWILLGIESLSQKVLDALDKGVKVEEIWSTLRLARKAGLNILGFYMVGCLEEDLADFNETYRQTEDMQKEGLLQSKQVCIMTAEPGSRLWKLAADKGWLRELHGRAHYTPHLDMPWASADEIIRRQVQLSSLRNGELCRI
jgi:anaerobic magnesium-protoporphyrin IX monomethyl ester cyclase